GSIGPGEIAAAQPDAHGAHKSGRDDIDQGVGKLARRKGFSLRDGSIPVAVWSKGQVVGHASRFDAWKGGDAILDLLEYCTALGLTFQIRGSAVVVFDFDGGSAVRLEAQVHVEHFDEAAEKQAGTDKKHAGEGDFGYDERAANTF